ncbi:unnamed protein product [Arabidopsis arenosa]|uniref:Pentatricopeptide repeat-containing protein n=1 Tax=Arabidopsis arenosa TaxID=38785 RepID=A0A8S2ABT9_ARAAE|nr:unnamed protein product [Arabidopsis arenosa]
MKSLLGFRKIPSGLRLRCLRNNKPFCSQSRFPQESENPSQEQRLVCGSTSEENPVTSKVSLLAAKPEQKDDASVIDVLLNRRNNPEAALRFYNWARPWRGSFEDGDVFWVLIHILVTSPETYGRASDLLIRYVSTSNPTPMASVLVSNLVDSAKLFGFEVNSRAFNYLLNAYSKDRQTDCAVDIVNQMLELGVIPFVPYVNRTLSALVQRNSLTEAKELYSRMVAIGVDGDNGTTQLLMRASLREEKPAEALEVFSRAIERGAEPDSLLYSLAVQACCKTLNLAMANSLLREMKEKKLCVPSQETYTSVILASVKQGNMEDAIRLKDEMVSDGISMNVVAATSLITGHCKNNDLGSALDLFYKMEKEGPSPNSVTFSVLIERFSKNGEMEKALEFYKKMESLGLTPSVFHVHTIIQGWLKGQKHEEALKLFDESFETGLANVFICNTILSWLCKQGKIDEATELLGKMESRGIGPNVVSYNNVMLAHCRKKNMDLARTVFSNMLEKGLKPNNYTYSILIDGCFKNHDEQNALEVVNQMTSSNIEVNGVVYQTIINGLCKVGQTSKARELLANMIEEKRFCAVGLVPDEIMYTVIVNGLSKKGQFVKVVKMFEEMKKNNVTPNVLIYNAVIAGHYREGNLDEAFRLHDEMLDKGILPDGATFDILVSGKVGKFQPIRAASL